MNDFDENNVEKIDNKATNKELKNKKNSDIIGNIIMISPVNEVFKKLTKISKERGVNISTLCEQIVEDYIKTNWQ